MFSLRFVGGGMDGRTALDESPPLTVRYTAPGSVVADVYVRVSQDPDGTIVYRKR